MARLLRATPLSSLAVVLFRHFAIVICYLRKMLVCLLDCDSALIAETQSKCRPEALEALIGNVMETKFYHNFKRYANWYITQMVTKPPMLMRTMIELAF